MGAWKWMVWPVDWPPPRGSGFPARLYTGLPCPVVDVLRAGKPAVLPAKEGRATSGAAHARPNPSVRRPPPIPSLHSPGNRYDTKPARNFSGSNSGNPEPSRTG